jgi:hypothetical protein
MPRYSAYGARDDRVQEDGDRGFVGFNNRLRPDQLKPGMLADSQNGRMGLNGQWEVRKGIDQILTPVTTTGALVLPFSIVDSDTDAAIADPDSNSGNLVITNITGSKYNTNGRINLSNISGITPDPNGNQDYTKTGTNELTVSGSFTGAADASVTVKYPILNDNAVEGIYGSCAFSDPNDNASQFIILATNTKAIAFNLETLVSTDIAYPAGITVASEVDMIQAFNKVFIFRDGQTALEWDGNTSNDFTKVTSGEYSQPVQIVCVSGEFALIENRGVVHQPDGVSQGDSITVIGDKTLSGDDSSGLVIGSNFIVANTYSAGSTTAISAATAASVSGGEYDGRFKVTITAAGHGKHVGDPITIAGFGDTKIDGKRFVAEKTTDTIIFYVIQNPSVTLSGDETVALAAGFEFYISDYEKTSAHVTDGASLTTTPVFTRKVSVGLGFTHMPAPPFAIYHQRRLVMPFNYTVNDTADSFTANGKLDELISSDILDTDTYDQIYANFRFNAGTADFIVGLHSFSEDVLVVFNRNSIHVVANSKVLNNATARLLTDEIGCLARKSIQQIGNQILFLSDNGVYGVSFIDEYNLRGTELPLSEAIDATIQRINKTYQSKAVSVYFDNRYYLAVPLDNSQENNAIIIYNFLNQQWESIDTVGTEGFHVTNMFIAGDGSDRGVYVVSDLGGINKLESRVDGNDRVTTVIGGALESSQVPGSVKTRQFTFNNLDRKKWRSFEMHVESQPDLDSNFDIDGELENLDRSIEIGTLRGFNGDSDLQAGSDISIRGRLGNPRAYGIQLDINNIVGRPKLRAVSVDGIESFRAVDKAE